MKAGIQYADGLSVEKICENGFREIELSIKNYDKLDEIKAAGVEISGVVFRLRSMVIEKNEKVFPRVTLFFMCPKRGNFGLYFPNMENIMGKSQDVVFKTRSIPGENIKLLQRRS